jgi:uncharacterized RDD family membrane protein YckC
MGALRQPTEDNVCASCGKGLFRGARYCALCGEESQVLRMARGARSQTELDLDRAYASVPLRLVAFIVDAIVYPIMGAWFACSLGLTWLFVSDWEFAVPSFRDIGDTAFTPIPFWLGMLFAVGKYVEHSASGHTIGCELFDLAIEKAESGEPPGLQRAIIRIVAAFISRLALWIGYAWAMWDPNRQTWHDKWSRTIVVEKPEKSHND